MHANVHRELAAIARGQTPNQHGAEPAGSQKQHIREADTRCSLGLLTHAEEASTDERRARCGTRTVCAAADCQHVRRNPSQPMIRSAGNRLYVANSAIRLSRTEESIEGGRAHGRSMRAPVPRLAACTRRLGSGTIPNDCS